MIREHAKMFCRGWNDAFHIWAFYPEKYRGGSTTTVYVYYINYLILYINYVHQI